MPWQYHQMMCVPFKLNLSVVDFSHVGFNSGFFNSNIFRLPTPFMSSWNHCESELQIAIHTISAHFSVWSRCLVRYSWFLPKNGPCEPAQQHGQHEKVVILVSRHDGKTFWSMSPKNGFLAEQPNGHLQENRSYPKLLRMWSDWVGSVWSQKKGLFFLAPKNCSSGQKLIFYMEPPQRWSYPNCSFLFRVTPVFVRVPVRRAKKSSPTPLWAVGTPSASKQP